MAAHALAAYATYPDNAQLNEVLQALGQGGFDKESICLLLSPAHPIATVLREASARLFEQRAGAVTRGMMNWLSEFGAVVIPTYGFFVRSRKFLHALVDRDGAVGYGHRGTLVSLGFSREEAMRFGDQVREVGVLLYVACSETIQTRCALELLRSTGAEEAGLVEHESALEPVAH
jgi:hypothetical protein